MKSKKLSAIMWLAFFMSFEYFIDNSFEFFVFCFKNDIIMINT